MYGYYCSYCHENKAYLCPDRVTGEALCYQRKREHNPRNVRGCNNFYCQLAGHTGIDCPLRVEEKAEKLISREWEYDALLKNIQNSTTPASYDDQIAKFNYTGLRGGRSQDALHKVNEETQKLIPREREYDALLKNIQTSTIPASYDDQIAKFNYTGLRGGRSQNSLHQAQSSRKVQLVNKEARRLIARERKYDTLLKNIQTSTTPASYDDQIAKFNYTGLRDGRNQDALHKVSEETQKLIPRERKYDALLKNIQTSTIPASYDDQIAKFNYTGLRGGRSQYDLHQAQSSRKVQLVNEEAQKLINSAKVKLKSKSIFSVKRKARNKDRKSSFVTFLDIQEKLAEENNQQVKDSLNKQLQNIKQALCKKLTITELVNLCKIKSELTQLRLELENLQNQQQQAQILQK
ncbi:7122_t:CDS:1 [Entrophospora sp. SA101]|nr:2083_t:CDS:1 [Entrophospora sp. SA101]CAJ0837356.1 7122_t:CDS:1 [Entrophospora sp. SA101]